MSSMLEQAIVDAQALREAALKNAEQALIEKFAPQIKDAVESLLEESTSVEAKHKKVKFEGQIYNVMEVNDGKVTLENKETKPFIVPESSCSPVTEEDLLQEEEGAMSGGSQQPAAAIEAPFAGSPVVDPEQNVQFSVDIEEPVYEFDLEALKNEIEDTPDKEMEGPQDILGDIGAGESAEQETAAKEGGDDILGGLELQESLEEDDDLVNEILDLMNEMYDGEENVEVLEEELIVDVSHEKDGTFRTDESTIQYYNEMQKAREHAEGLAQEKEKENENLKETLKRFKLKNKQYKDAVEKLSEKLNETLLSNAKLVYCNKTLGDASLNERQKSKIVEAIAKARTPEEAKNLHEALNATVTSGSDNKSPRTLSESVTRKSTLSGILPRRKQQVNESEQHTFADHMKKLAGIK